MTDDRLHTPGPGIEIDVTPAMAEAGAEAMSRFFCWEVDRPDEIAVAVFSAMVLASLEAKAAPS